MIQTRPATPEYAEGWDRIFGKRTELDGTGMCPNCLTPWKCNGPHLPDQEMRLEKMMDECMCWNGPAVP
jgi:hypothetical protein